MNALKNPVSIERELLSITCDGVCKGIGEIGIKEVVRENVGIKELTKRFRQSCTT